MVCRSECLFDNRFLPEAYYTAVFCHTQAFVFLYQGDFYLGYCLFYCPVDNAFIGIDSISDILGRNIFKIDLIRVYVYGKEAVYIFSGIGQVPVFIVNVPVFVDGIAVKGQNNILAGYGILFFSIFINNIFDFKICRNIFLTRRFLIRRAGTLYGLGSPSVVGSIDDLKLPVCELYTFGKRVCYYCIGITQSACRNPVSIIKDHDVVPLKKGGVSDSVPSAFLRARLVIPQRSILREDLRKIKRIRNSISLRLSTFSVGTSASGSCCLAVLIDGTSVCT